MYMFIVFPLFESIDDWALLFFLFYAQYVMYVRNGFSLEPQSFLGL